MVLKRPKMKTPPAGESKSKVRLNEHMVKKALEVNPKLRQGARDTGEVIEGLKGESPAEEESAGPQRSKKDLSDRRKGALSFFFEQKAEEFDERLKVVLEKERAIQKEKDELKKAVAEEVIDFVALMSGGADTPEAREVMRSFRDFLIELGIKDTDVVSRSKGRR